MLTCDVLNDLRAIGNGLGSLRGAQQAHIKATILCKKWCEQRIFRLLAARKLPNAFHYLCESFI